MPQLIRNGMLFPIPDAPPPPCGHQIGKTLPFVYDVGGHVGSGKTNACAAKAIAIATGIDRVAIDRALEAASIAIEGARDWAAADGYDARAVNAVLAACGYRYTAIRVANEPCRGVHPSDLPRGRLVVRTDTHATAIVDGTVRDTFNVSDAGFRAISCVVGFWEAP